jgi:hypothetical protein
LLGLLTVGGVNLKDILLVFVCSSRSDEILGNFIGLEKLLRVVTPRDDISGFWRKLGEVLLRLLEA